MGEEKETPRVIEQRRRSGTLTRCSYSTDRLTECGQVESGHLIFIFALEISKARMHVHFTTFRIA